MKIEEAIEQANRAIAAAMSVPTNTACLSVDALYQLVEAVEHYNECYGD